MPKAGFELQPNTDSKGLIDSEEPLQPPSPLNSPVRGTLEVHGSETRLFYLIPQLDVGFSAFDLCFVAVAPILSEGKEDQPKLKDGKMPAWMQSHEFFHRRVSCWFVIKKNSIKTAS